MSPNEARLLCLRDMLEQLTARQQRLEWATDLESIRVLTETMIRDLVRCQRLCEELQQRGGSRSRA